jgi:glycerophosphoryl diester phosphodiesterase
MLDGADGVEMDVMLCASGEPVVVHDDDLGRVTGGKEGSGLDVRTSPLCEIQRHDVGRGERVPTLSQVLETLGDHCLINIELKSRDVKTAADYAALVHNDGLATAVAELLRRGRRPPGTTLVSSFDPFQLWRFAQAAADLLPQLPLAFLFHRNQGRPLREAWLSTLLPLRALHPDAALIDAVSMRSWRKQGYFVHTWTVDAPSEIAALAALGVDAIITNTPAVARARLAAAPDAEPGLQVAASPSHSP